MYYYDMKSTFACAFLFLILVSLDWGSKALAHKYLPRFDDPGVVTLDNPPRLCLAVVYNTEVSDDWQIWRMSHAVALLALLFAWTTKMSPWGLSIMTAGAAGNSLEAIVQGRTVDFIGILQDPSCYSYSVYNFADLLVYVGISMVLLEFCWKVIKGLRTPCDLLLGSRWICFREEFSRQSKPERSGSPSKRAEKQPLPR